MIWADASLSSRVVDPPREQLDQDFDMVKQVIGHRLQQRDIQQVLEKLSTVDQQRFTEKIASLLRKTSALLEVSRRVSDSLSLDVLLPSMVRLISELLEADRCTLFLYDRDTKELYSRVAHGEGLAEIRFPSHHGIAGAVFINAAALIIPDAYADPRFNRSIDQQTGYRTRNILCAPILNNQGHCIGASQVLNKCAGDFTQEDLRLLQAITKQAAAAFTNAQLHEQIKRAHYEEGQLLEITTAIAKELHLQPLLQKIIDTVTVILDCDRSTLFMHDPKTKELWSRVAQGTGVREIRFPSHLGIAGCVLTTGNTINIPDAYQDDRFNPNVDKATGYKTDTILCMPVINKQGTIIGVTQALNKKDGPFTMSDEQRLRAFSAQAAVALENAQLFEDVINMKNYNESILQSMANGVVTVAADGQIKTANDAALRLFRVENQPDRIIGQRSDRLFYGKNAWLADTIRAVCASRTTELILDTDLWLRQEPAVGIQERRREKASVNLTVVPLTGANGEDMGCLLMIEDITTEKRLRGTMARYMTKEVADKLMEEGEEALGGQMQKASVLFTDIRDFTSMTERLGPQETVALLNEYFGVMVDILLEHGGILDKYIGDAIMAVFGAPFAGRDDADNAVRAAIGMIRALRALNAHRHQTGHMPIHMGVGINTDEVISGNIGSLKRMDYTVIGDGVNLASRLEGINKPYGTEILLSECTVAELKGTYTLREIDRIRVKGKQKPVAIFEVMDQYEAAHLSQLHAVLPTYTDALKHYRQRDWSTAHQLFDEIVQRCPHDGVSNVYRERCAYFSANPPGDEWDGIWTMKTK